MITSLTVDWIRDNSTVQVLHKENVQHPVYQAKVSLSEKELKETNLSNETFTDCRMLHGQICIFCLAKSTKY